MRRKVPTEADKNGGGIFSMREEEGRTGRSNFMGQMTNTFQQYIGLLPPLTHITVLTFALSCSPSLIISLLLSLSHYFPLTLSLSFSLSLPCLPLCLLLHCAISDGAVVNILYVATCILCIYVYIRTCI